MKFEEERNMNFDVSVIIPMKNLGESIKSVLKGLKNSTEGINTEYILLDINSSDNTMLQALNSVKQLELKGRVIQCGNSSYGAVLNSGLRNALGLYSTFVFPKHMYKNFIKTYYEGALESSADVIFGKKPESDSTKGISLSSVKISGEEMFNALICGYISLDLGAMMFKNSFINDRKVFFDDDSSVGYAEEYVYKSLLLAEKIFQCDYVMERDSSIEIPKSLSAADDFSCFGKIEGMLRIRELLDYCNAKKDTKEKFEKEKIPDVVLGCVDFLMKKGYDIKTVKRALKIKGYDKLLMVSAKSNKTIKRAVFNFNYMPWIYKPR